MAGAQLKTFLTTFVDADGKRMFIRANGYASSLREDHVQVKSGWFSSVLLVNSKIVNNNWVMHCSIYD